MNLTTFSFIVKVLVGQNVEYFRSHRTQVLSSRNTIKFIK